MKIVMIIHILSFLTSFTVDLKHDYQVYSLLNQVIIDRKIKNLYINTDNVSYRDGKKSLIFDPNDVDSWFWKNNLNKDLRERLKVIDKEYLLQQVSIKSSFKWDKKLIKNEITLRNKGFHKSTADNYTKDKTYPIYAISIPIVEKSNEFAFVRFTCYSAPNENYVVILLYQRLNDKWIYLGERSISMS